MHPTTTICESYSWLRSARETIEQESLSVQRMAHTLGKPFVEVCELLMRTQGNVVIVGMGKSGHVGRKIAATFSSTGTPALFVNAGEAGHGDLGVIRSQDVVLLISNSGETPEIIALLPRLRELRSQLIVMTGRIDSSLALSADWVLHTGVVSEACPHDLAPTTSTTCCMVMGDALALCLLQARGFDAETFHKLHPSGSLGSQLATAADVMCTGAAIPRCPVDATLEQGLIEMTGKRLGMTAVTDADNTLLGIFTDGDLRRLIHSDPNWHRAQMANVMIQEPTVAAPTMKVRDLVKLLTERKINGLFVVDTQRHVLGALNLHSLLGLGQIGASR